MKDYLITIHGSYEAWNSMSPEQIQQVMQGYHAFVDFLKKEDRYQGGSALEEEAHHLRAVQGGIVVDGPYAESKEVLSGYILFAAKDGGEALEIAKRCPALAHGDSVRLRALSKK